MILLGPQYKMHHGMGGKRNLSTDSICAACHGKNPSRVPSDAQMQGSQHLKGRKIYSLAIFFVLFYLIKTAILLSHLLLGLSY